MVQNTIGEYWRFGIITCNLMFFNRILSNTKFSHFSALFLMRTNVNQQSAAGWALPMWVFPNISHLSTLFCDLYNQTLLPRDNDSWLTKIVCCDHKKNSVRPHPLSCFLLAENMSFAWGHELINLSPAASRIEDINTNHLKTLEWHTSAYVRIFFTLHFNFTSITWGFALHRSPS